MSARSSIRLGATSIVGDVEAIHSFLAAQRDVLGVSIAEEIVATQCTVVVGKIEVLQGLTMGIATELTRVFKTGPWSAAQIRELAGAVQASMNRNSTTPERAKRRPNQSMRSWNSFMTMGDIEIQRDPTIHLSIKIARNVTRAVKLGLSLPSETTSGHIVAVFLTHHAEQYDVATKNNIVVQFKSQLKRALKYSCVCLIFFKSVHYRLFLFTVVACLLDAP
jgi:hypothetical protein